MKQVTHSRGHAATVESRDATTGTLTMVAGGLFIVGALLSEVIDWLWGASLVGFALLIYVVPRLHRVQAPADGWAGRVGSALAVAGAVLLLALGAIFLVWEAVGDPGEPAWTDVAWLVGFFSFLVGIVLFAIGSALAKKFPPAAPLLMLFGLVAAVAIDMATGAFFEDDASTTAWGYYVGVPLFGLGLAWMGYALHHSRSERAASA